MGHQQPAVEREARSRANSIGVRRTSSPSSLTAGRPVDHELVRFDPRFAASRPARRSTAWTRAMSSPGANGFVT